MNAEDSIIVLYDWEGDAAGSACALLSEKGVENAMLLHGGRHFLPDAEDKAQICRDQARDW